MGRYFPEFYLVEFEGSLLLKFRFVPCEYVREGLEVSLGGLFVVVESELGALSPDCELVLVLFESGLYLDVCSVSDSFAEGVDDPKHRV